MPTHELDLMHGSVPYTIRRSNRAKRLRITLDESQGLILVLPRGISEQEGQKFLAEKRDWIQRTLARLDRQKIHRADLLKPPARVPFHGRDVPVTTRLGGDMSAVHWTGKELLLFVPDPRHGRPVLANWFRRRATHFIPEKVKELMSEDSPLPASCRSALGSVQRIQVRNQKTRWGSCSARGTLSFNWRLILTPDAVVEYIILHEMIHLTHPHHQGAFWKAVLQACPSARKHTQWLRTEGATLMRAWPPDLCLT
ncbi:MAG: M48 family metallopeptidase [Candidatus Pacebacteria bacterium]|nr:M48 family metallopeptidase [Candidatus Paceibacterota bacterium]